jgi:hypothetical protein
VADCLLSESSLGYWLALVQLVHCLFMAFNEALLLFFPLSNSTVQSVLSETSDVPLVFVLPERVIFPVKSSKNYNLQLKNKIKYLSFCSSCRSSYISLFSQPMFFLLVLEILILLCFDY